MHANAVKADRRNDTVTSALSGVITVTSPRGRQHLESEQMSPHDIFLSVGSQQPQYASIQQDQKPIKKLPSKLKNKNKKGLRDSNSYMDTLHEKMFNPDLVSPRDQRKPRSI